MLLEILESTVRNVLARLLVSLRAPVVVGEFEPERLLGLSERLQDLDPCFNDFGSDSVGRDGRDTVRFLGLNGTR